MKFEDLNIFKYFNHHRLTIQRSPWLVDDIKTHRSRATR